MEQWSRKYIKCKQCKSKLKPHKGKGLCVLCYDKIRARTPNGRKNQANYRNRHRKEIYRKQKAHYLQKRAEMLMLMGGECIRCGFSDERALQIDHINGGGIKDRVNLNTKDFHRKVLKSIKNKENKYQLLCANCNWIKRSENKEWGQTPKKS